jgi:hypothetical protein
MSRIITIYLVVAAALVAVNPAKAAEDGHHPHHVAAAISMARHNGKNSAAIGLDYAYIFESRFALGVCYEDVRGDFDIQAFGVGFGKFFANGWRFSTGPGIERKLKTDKNLFLWHVTGGYDWHDGNWSFGPQATIDFIQEASTTNYLGFSVGYGS